MKKFYDITRKTNAREYIECLTKEKDNLVIYSPTSIKRLNIELNGEASIISTHSITKQVDKINKVIANKRIKSVIAIGGGTACDIAKYIAYNKKIECICIPTMLSTNVYSTNKVALIIEGYKTTLNAKLPDEIILDTNILKKSTQQNLYGIADILSIHTALCDWKISINNNNEKDNPKVYNLAFNLFSEVKYFIANNNIDVITSNTDRLFYYIGQAGHITNLYGTGKPESGSEHIFAKELERVIEIPHGIAVSIGIILMSLYQNNIDYEIIDCIRKLRIFHNVRDYKISELMLKNILLNLKPRIDRFSIINIITNDDKKIDEILNEFKKIVGEEFYANN